MRSVALGLASISVYPFRKDEAMHFYVRGSQMENQLNQACSRLPMSSQRDVLCFTCLTERHRLSQNVVGSYWHCWENIVLLLKLLCIGSDAMEEINHVHIQRVKIVKACTEAAGVRNSTSLRNSLACGEYHSSSGDQCFVFVGSGDWFPEAT